MTFMLWTAENTTIKNMRSTLKKIFNRFNQKKSMLDETKIYLYSTSVLVVLTKFLE